MANNKNNINELVVGDGGVNERIAELTSAVAEAEENYAQACEELAALHVTHANEIRMIRFELGEAQETVSQHELVNAQLSSDLTVTHGYRVQLESMLDESEHTCQSKMRQLEKQNRKLRRESRENKKKLKAKSEAINCLLADIAKKSQQIDSISKIEDVLHEIDDRMSERIDVQAPVERERITRVLIGSAEGQDLRFPLFKDRLTIGRAQQNDIQLQASYVSRRHAVIVTEGNSTRFIDWGSKNGVFVNSKRITEHFLKNGDIVTVGSAEFRYEERPKRSARNIARLLPIV